MDYIVLLFVWKVLHCESKHIHIVAGAGVGAVLTCILIILPIPNTFLEMLLFHVVVNTCMIQIGLKIKKNSIFLRAIVLLYIGTVLMGGILESINQYAKIGSMLFVFALLGYYISLGIWNYLAKLQRWNCCHVKVQIEFRGQELEVDALIDTGNSLYDPVTGKPISIIAKESVKPFLRVDEKFRYVPLRTVTNAEKFFPIICVEKIKILDEQKQCFHQVLFAIGDEEFGKNGTYKMILNPNLF